MSMPSLIGKSIPLESINFDALSTSSALCNSVGLKRWATGMSSKPPSSERKLSSPTDSSLELSEFLEAPFLAFRETRLAEEVVLAEGPVLGIGVSELEEVFSCPPGWLLEPLPTVVQSLKMCHARKPHIPSG